MLLINAPSFLRHQAAFFHLIFRQKDRYDHVTELGDASKISNKLRSSDITEIRNFSNGFLADKIAKHFNANLNDSNFIAGLINHREIDQLIKEERYRIEHVLQQQIKLSLSKLDHEKRNIEQIKSLIIDSDEISRAIDEDLAARIGNFLSQFLKAESNDHHCYY